PQDPVGRRGHLRRTRFGRLGGGTAEDGRRRPHPGRRDDRRYRDRSRTQGPQLGPAYRRRLRYRNQARLRRRSQRRTCAGTRGQLSVRVRLEVPATSANLGPGFDSYGLALDIVDTLTLTVHDAAVDLHRCVEVTGEGADVLPRDRSHLINRIIGEVLDAEFPDVAAELKPRLTLECVNRIPHSRGMGSSAAAVVAGIDLAAELGAWSTGAELSRDRILEIAIAVEGHPDNAAPAIFGGLNVSLSTPVKSWQV